MTNNSNSYSKFSIQNFRVFERINSFDFRPITFLIGPNSSGKSSLMKVLKSINKSFKMNNPKYLVNIVYVPVRVTGQQKVLVNGVTQSMPAYSGDMVVASMPEIRIAASGSSYATALSNLLLIATASTTYGNGFDPLGGYM